MAVKRTPKLLDYSKLSYDEQDKVDRVVRFVKQQSEPVSIGDVMNSFRISTQKAWEGLDLAWNCGLLTKVKEGNSAYWIIREKDGPTLIDGYRGISITTKREDGS